MKRNNLIILFATVFFVVSAVKFMVIVKWHQSDEMFYEEYEEADYDFPTADDSSATAGDYDYVDLLTLEKHEVTLVLLLSLVSLLALCAIFVVICYKAADRRVSSRNDEAVEMDAITSIV